MKANTSITSLKGQYVAYFLDVPIQKYAAMAIGRNEDTIIRWRNEDQDFAESVQKAKAEWIRKRLISTKAEFALERLERAAFGPKAIIEADVSIVDDKSLEERKAISENYGKYLMWSTRK